jgi:hypothetical protein
VKTAIHGEYFFSFDSEIDQQDDLQPEGRQAHNGTQAKEQEENAC